MRRKGTQQRYGSGEIPRRDMKINNVLVIERHWVWGG